MDTKLKNFSRKWYVKAAAYAVMMVCVTIIIMDIWKFNDSLNESYALDILEQKEYGESYKLRLDAEHLANIIYESEVKYESRDRIKSGYYAEKRVESVISLMCSEWPIQGYSASPVLDYGYSGYGGEVRYSWEHDETIGSAEGEMTRESLLARKPMLEESLRTNIIKGQLMEYDQLKDELNNYPNMEGEVLRTKEEAGTWISGKNLLYVILGKKETVLGGQGEDIEDIRERALEYMEEDSTNYCVMVGMDTLVYETEEAEWKQTYQVCKEAMEEILVLTAVVLLMLVYLMIVTGRRPKEKELHLYPFDKIWGEAQAAGLFCASLAAGACLSSVFLEIPMKAENLYWKMLLAGTDIFIVLALIILLSQVRRLKAKKFLEGFVIYRCLRKIWKMLFSSWKRGKISKRALLLAIVLPILCATWVGAPFVIVFLIYMVYKYLNDFINICQGAKAIREGDLQYQITVTEGEGDLHSLADNINQISQGLENAVSSELKSERLKSELISNVSHDLKTPLTSIVTYVDLLKKEEIQNEKAKEYIEVIDRKAERLTALTSDLFEAAKASSGDMPVNLEKIDFTAVTRQALGEYEEKIAAAGLEIRTKFPETPAYVKADGRLTWRVTANLLSNLVKYAQPGSRVYLGIEASAEGGFYRFTMKNISSQELNIPVEELMERFKRGDASRNSEGSGLGLNIANSLITLQHGKFEVQVDGDLFKAIVMLPKAE